MIVEADIISRRWMIDDVYGNPSYNSSGTLYDDSLYNFFKKGALGSVR